MDRLKRSHAVAGVYASLRIAGHTVGMARIIALAPAYAASLPLVETTRRVIVLGCAAALILAQSAIPHL